MALRVTLDLSALASSLVICTSLQTGNLCVQIQCYTQSHTLNLLPEGIKIDYKKSVCRDIQSKLCHANLNSMSVKNSSTVNAQVL